MRIRHPYNRNLKLHYGDTWNGLPVIAHRGPLVVEYLEDILSVMDRTVHDYARSCVIRFDAHFPDGYEGIETVVITRFRNSLRAKIYADLQRKARFGTRTYRCDVRVIWAKEQNGSEHPHYHIAITLNRDAYFTLGRFKTTDESARLQCGPLSISGEYIGGENLSDRIKSAWASAIGWPQEVAGGLVHFPEKPVYSIDRNSSDCYGQFAEAFRRLSYLAKADTKIYGDYSRYFGCSRN